MAGITTYSELVAAVASTLNRSDLDSDIPGWITLAEERHRGAVENGGVRIREMLTRSTEQITSRYLDLPDTFIEMKRLRVQATLLLDPWQVTQVTPDEITEYRRKAARNSSVFAFGQMRPVNLPNFYSVQDQIEFDVDPSEFDDDLPYAEFLFYDSDKVLPLSEDEPSNVILARSSGLYLYGTLVHSAPFLGDDARIEVWEAAYQSILSGVNALDRKRGGQIASRVVGATP